MSYQLLKTDILFYQRLLKSTGFYTGKLDGKWGPLTDAADNAFTAQSQQIALQYGTFDPRSESNIVTLIPKAQILARQVLKAFTTTGSDVRIISGTRTYAEQDMIYKQGRFGNKLPKVTNARGGQSNHNFGLAWDIGLFESGAYITTDTKYKALAAKVLPLFPDLLWGGNWVTFKDNPHYQLKAVSDSVTKLRDLFEKGISYA
ncbi:peptidase M15 [Chitinophaga silvatica]|uniref:Peptidase M15 n=1 Tax=Chitinophaga silvatica TaxID=2282649 RepID=A0A3E1YDR0_9BACT|nr:M15 family metallopeptidase [Chitinophaga silvatica]RFS24695.1 peptidase M15 [Chitinophaga silvatica]